MKGYKLVVVVSALGRKPDPYATDTLLDMVNFPANHNSSRELDLLLSCGETIASVVLSNELQKHHITATALTGAQAGFVTNDDFNQAKIKKVNPERLRKEFSRRGVVLFRGSQGKPEAGEIRRLGGGAGESPLAA